MINPRSNRIARALGAVGPISTGKPCKTKAAGPYSVEAPVEAPDFDGIRMTLSREGRKANAAYNRIVQIARELVNGNATLLALNDAIYEFDHAMEGAKIRRDQIRESRRA